MQSSRLHGWESLDSADPSPYKPPHATLTKGHLQEVEADFRERMWREIGGCHGVTLVATDAGLNAIAIEYEEANTATLARPTRRPRNPRPRPPAKQTPRQRRASRA